MIPIAPLALVLVHALPQAQGPAPAPAASDEPAPVPLEPLRENYDTWLVRNRVEQVINTDILTLGAINRGVDAARSRVQINTRDDWAMVARQVAQQLSRERLWVQGGQEMGIPEDTFQQSVDRLLAEERQTKGALGHAQALQQKGFDRQDEQAAASDGLYADWFRASVAGYAPGSNGRQVVDTFLRPGQLQAIYEQYPDEFAEPPTVQLQLLVVTAAQAGSLEDAAQIVGDFRVDAMAGEDFDELCRDFSAIGSQAAGRTDHMRPDQLADPLHRAFVASRPEVGDFSEVLPFALPENPGEVVGSQLVRLIARSAVEGPRPFADRDIQKLVNMAAESFYRRRRLDLAGARLRRQSFIWPPPLAAGSRP